MCIVAFDILKERFQGGLGLVSHVEAFTEQPKIRLLEPTPGSI